jgi:hypothetical protein
MQRQMAGVAISLYSTEMHEKNYNQILNSDTKKTKKKGGGISVHFCDMGRLRWDSTLTLHTVA